MSVCLSLLFFRPHSGIWRRLVACMMGVRMSTDLLHVGLHLLDVILYVGIYVPPK